MFWWSIAQVNAQECDAVISGRVLDEHTGEAMVFATVYLKEAQQAAVSDTAGRFEISGLCQGSYHLSVHHVGCETKELFFTLQRDTHLHLELDHVSHMLGEFAIVSERGETKSQESASLHTDHITRQSDRSLATMLQGIPGVNVIKNGSGISKPVVHGMYGNRLLMINNGIAQGGQQWGVDHNPEIDPLVAHRITVVKGVGTVKYQGSGLGSVVVVEPKEIHDEPHLHGDVKYFFETNGLAHGTNVDLAKKGRFLSWRGVGTLKRSGDRRAPDYFLRNTGAEEANMALHLVKDWSNRSQSSAYISSFNATYGILRGSHVGNLTDLQSAFQRATPFFTEDAFSYTINAPRQQVNHHLAKLKHVIHLNPQSSLEVTYSFQHNARKEFDVRRGGRTDDPALSLKQQTHFAEVSYRRALKNDWILRSGIQSNRVDNQNIPETGILPLIPDYISRTTGGYASLSRQWVRTTVEAGARYDYESRNIATISSSIPREIIRYATQYHSGNAAAGITYDVSEHWHVGLNAGVGTRNPAINELYSAGLHQGVSGIEEGDPGLGQEHAFKQTLSLKGNVRSKVYFDAVIYHQHVLDYIFLQPQDEVRLTIRGAFPVFRYEQTDARLIGGDVAATWQATERMHLTVKYSHLRGDDVAQGIPLVFMPANNAYGEWNYQLPSLGRFQKVEFQVNQRYVFAQHHLLPTQDFVPPPDAYFLLGAKASAQRQFVRSNLRLHLRVENLLNTTYRDYLNRQRYFADEPGINLIIGMNLSF